MQHSRQPLGQLEMPKGENHNHKTSQRSSQSIVLLHPTPGGCTADSCRRHSAPQKRHLLPVTQNPHAVHGNATNTVWKRSTRPHELKSLPKITFRLSGFTNWFTCIHFPVPLTIYNILLVRCYSLKRSQTHKTNGSAQEINVVLQELRLKQNPKTQIKIEVVQIPQWRRQINFTLQTLM